jgi:citrate lyase subunit beta / citryl-CoA lyase
MRDSLPPVMLYVPGSEPGRVAKALALDVDAVILDLEDAVAPAAKDRARQICADVLGSRAPGPERWVRINDLETPLWPDDLRAVTRAGLSGVVVPKVESAGQLAALDGALTILERESGLASGSVGLLATIETPLGLSRARSIAAAGGRLRALGFGAGDFSRIAGLDYPATDGGAAAMLSFARCELVVASSLAGLHKPHDSVYGNYRDLDGLRREAAFARQLGFGGKHCIHPTQVEPLAACFGPTAAELEQAERMVEAYAQALAEGRGAVGVDGILVDEPIARRARQTLGRVRSAGAAT